MSEHTGPNQADLDIWEAGTIKIVRGVEISLNSSSEILFWIACRH